MTFFVNRLKSFGYAFKGFVCLFKETNAIIHLIAAVIVVVISSILHISSSEWLWITLSICLVFMAESFNTAIEYLADEITSDRNKNIGRAKDLGAAATLMTAIFAVVVASIILFPKLFS
ncbi:diacylglycerol kinase [Carboxylicivirga sp. N1Y90]|uniref:diacylglycerol kinase n=1 Tax=Carboxylicivirga fragile TaxID=3417571 RepID=UPI003D34EECE|nr:diacylglycerol kinase family protein [Marinilabiliaceae bacterium N1Y90]